MMAFNSCKICSSLLPSTNIIPLCANCWSDHRSEIIKLIKIKEKAEIIPFDPPKNTEFGEVSPYSENHYANDGIAIKNIACRNISDLNRIGGMID